MAKVGSKRLQPAVFSFIIKKMPRKRSAKKIIAMWLGILVIGGLGGFLAEHLLLPALAQTSFFQRWQFFKNLGQGTTIINRSEEIKITEDAAWQSITEYSLRSVVGVKAMNAKKIVDQTNSSILTSDGLIIVPQSFIHKNQTYLVNLENQDIPADLFFQDPNSSLTLLKIDKNNLTVLPLASPEKTSLGEPVMLVGLSADKDGNWSSIVNQGIISQITSEGFLTNIKEDDHSTKGSLLVNIRQELVGINIFDSQGRLLTIDTAKIKSLLDAATIK